MGTRNHKGRHKKQVKKEGKRKEKENLLKPFKPPTYETDKSSEKTEADKKIDDHCRSAKFSPPRVFPFVCPHQFNREHLAAMPDLKTKKQKNKTSKSDQEILIHVEISEQSVDTIGDANSLPFR